MTSNKQISIIFQILIAGWVIGSSLVWTSKNQIKLKALTLLVSGLCIWRWCLLSFGGETNLVSAKDDVTIIVPLRLGSAPGVTTSPSRLIAVALACRFGARNNTPRLSERGWVIGWAAWARACPLRPGLLCEGTHGQKTSNSALCKQKHKHVLNFCIAKSVR